MKITRRKCNDFSCESVGSVSMGTWVSNKKGWKWTWRLKADANDLKLFNPLLTVTHMIVDVIILAMVAVPRSRWNAAFEVMLREPNATKRDRQRRIGCELTVQNHKFFFFNTVVFLIYNNLNLKIVPPHPLGWENLLIFRRRNSCL